MRDKDGFIAEAGVAFHRESIISEEDSGVSWGRKTQLRVNSVKPWTTHRSGAISCPRKPLPYGTLPGNKYSVNACIFPVMFASDQMLHIGLNSASCSFSCRLVCGQVEVNHRQASLPTRLAQVFSPLIGAADLRPVQ